MEYICQECEAKGEHKEFKNSSGLSGHRQFVHGIKPETEEGKEGKEKGVDLKTTDRETYFPVTLYLPSSIFSLYHYAKKAGFSDHKSLVDFIVEYCEFGFMKAHEGYGLTLAQVDKEVAASEIAGMKEQITEILNRLPVPAEAKK